MIAVAVKTGSRAAYGAQASKDEKLSTVIEYLLRRGKQRPASLKALRGSVAALFQPTLTEAETETETDSLLTDLMVQGVFVANQSKVMYSMPDE